MQAIEEAKEHCRFVAQGIVDASVKFGKEGAKKNDYS